MKRTAVDRTRVLAPLVVLAGAWLAVSSVRADTPPPAAPTHRELWVPERSLASALKTMPKAVLVTREQFQSLLRDSAAPGKSETPSPPVPAVLRSATYSGSLGEHAALFTAEFLIEGLGDGWAELPLTLDPRWLGSVTVDGVGALAASNEAVTLIVRGTGRHVVRVDFAAPILQSAGTRTLTLRAPGTVEASLVLNLPETANLESALPFTRHEGLVTFALPTGRDEFQVTWSDRAVPTLETSGVFQTSHTLYSLDAAQVRADLALTFDSALKNVPITLAFPVAAGIDVLAVEGSELARWSLAGDRVAVEFLPGDRRHADLRLQLALPVPDAATRFDLPAPVAEGIHRASGVFSLLTHPGLRVRRVTTGALATRDDSQAPPAFAGRPDFAGTWVFPILLQPPGIEIERLNSRFTATLDTQVSLARDALHLTRHFALQPREGTLFSPVIDGLHENEMIESVRRADGSEVEWRGLERGLTVVSPAGTRPGESLNFIVTSTLRPPGWEKLGTQPIALSLATARVPAAEKISGYVCVDFDPSLRVTTPKTDGLEPRDPRQFAGRLPLAGRLAWFRLDAFQLDLAVGRRPVEFDATFALDALPLLNSLEIEGQVTLVTAHGGLRELTLAFPPAMAAAVRWDSPIIAEKSMTEDGRWTLKFHQETTGSPAIRFHASVPLDEAAVPGATERRFSTRFPFPAVPAARRTTGTLVVEANSDTELSFSPEALDDLDLLQVPSIDGYAPRHRLVAGYAWRGGQPALSVDGVRHRPGSLPSTVVDSLTLDSVVSADGPARHQAVLAIRSAGAQFLDLSLPPEARVLSAVIDGQAVKPIRGPGGALRLPLGTTQATLQVIYETAAARMVDVSRATLPPIALDGAIPVLHTTWRLHLPEGFSYSEFETNLTAASPPPDPPSLARAFADSPLIAALTSPRHTGRVLLEIERPSGVTAGDFSDAASSGKAMTSNSMSLPTEFEIITSEETLSEVIKKRNLIEKWRVATADEAYNKLRRMIEADEENGTDLLKIEVRSDDAAEARDLANDVAEAYVARRKRIENERVQLAFQTLSHTRKAQEQEVERARTKMLELVQELGIVDLNPTAPFAYTRGNEPNGGTESIAMDAQRMALEKMNQIRDYKAQLQALGGKKEDELIHAAASMGLLDPKSEKLFAQYQSDRRTAAQLIGSGLGETHPDVASLQAGLQAQKSQLDEVLKPLGENLRDKITTSETILANIEKLTAEQKDDSLLDRGKYAEYQQARDQYGMAQEILQKMVDEQERARVVNLMPRKPATIHEYADVDASAAGPGQPGVATRVVTATGTAAESQPTVVSGPSDERKTVEGFVYPKGPVQSVVAIGGLGAGGGLGGGGVDDAVSASLRPAMRAGLLPLEFSLPEGGHTFTFTGHYPPAAVSFRAVAWERQVRLAWLLMVAGGLAFAVLQRVFRRPVLIGLLGALVWHGLPLMTGRTEVTPLANALLVGWLVAWALTLGLCVVRRVARGPSGQKEVVCG